jgi:phage shock protein E
MKWIVLVALVVLVLTVWRLTARAGLAPELAREHLAKGAMLVDVRTPEEFQAKHLPQAINIPLAELAVRLPQEVPDKGRVILLHCRSGARSARAEQQLRALGYTNVFNLGSYSAAEKIVRGLPAGPIHP